jgi:hypothetical protein
MADTAQHTTMTPASEPTCAPLKRGSGAIYGARYNTAMRSRNTTPT